MHSRCNGSILLGTIAVCVALAVMESDVNVMKPFDPKMCQRFCNQISGCSSYIYRTSALSCHPIQAQSGKGICFINSTKDKKRMDADNAAKCNQGWKMFHTRVGIILCRPREEREVGMARIIMLPSMTRAPRQQLYIDNNSMVEYPFWRNIGIKAVAYISSQRKLLVSYVYPNLLFFTPTDEERKSIIRTKNSIMAIAIDDHKQLVFMNVEHPEPCVCVSCQQTARTLHRCLVSQMPILGFFSGGLIADHKRSLIYVLCPEYNILQLTYQGVSKGNIGDRSGLGYGFYLDMKGCVLYYQDLKHYLHKLSLSDHTDTITHALTISPAYAMLTLGDILYIIPGSGEHQEHIIVVNMNDMSTTAKVAIFHKGRVAMCLIP